jgi:hypothetical protein
VDVQDIHQLPGLFAVYQLSDHWLLIARDPDGPHGGWLRLPLSECDLFFVAYPGGEGSSAESLTLLTARAVRLHSDPGTGFVIVRRNTTQQENHHGVTQR